LHFAKCEINLIDSMNLLQDYNEYDSLFVCGDIHGEFKKLLYEIKRKGINNAIILLAGD